MYTQNSQSPCKENARQHYNCSNSKHTKNKKNKNTVTIDWIENKINKVHNAYLCFIEFKVGNWSEKKTLPALFCIACQYVISTGTISNTSIQGGP